MDSCLRFLDEDTTGATGGMAVDEAAREVEEDGCIPLMLLYIDLDPASLVGIADTDSLPAAAVVGVVV